jgi:hypothetical protein
LAIKICHIQDLARKSFQNLNKNICHKFDMQIVRYWQILVPNQMAAKILACLSFGNQILATNQSGLLCLQLLTATIPSKQCHANWLD